MKRQTIVIGTRNSKLALWQADFVAKAIEKKYPGLKAEKRPVLTKGDKILDAPLAKIGGKGLFTKELETAMLQGEIDLAVHSLKDMPAVLPPGLTLAAITRRGETADALVSPVYKTLDKLPPGAKVGTSSLRRRAQLLYIRPDLNIKDLRGNVNTRLKKLTEENFAAIVLAAAGLKRLGFAEAITQILPGEQILPAAGQGALAVETRADDREILELTAFLNDADTFSCAMAERAFLAQIGGSCQVPVGIYGERTGDNIRLEAVIASPDGRRLYRDIAWGREPEILGRTLAEKLLQAGGREILREIGMEV